MKDWRSDLAAFDQYLGRGWARQDSDKIKAMEFEGGNKAAFRKAPAEARAAYVTSAAYQQGCLCRGHSFHLAVTINTKMLLLHSISRSVNSSS